MPTQTDNRNLGKNVLTVKLAFYKKWTWSFEALNSTFSWKVELYFLLKSWEFTDAIQVQEKESE